ncbi:MAG: tRNA adenosine(34) deaminase TadA [Actinomycetota bacterium]
MTDVEAMRRALEEARSAIAHDDVPVGAVVVVGEAVIASAHNERELRADPTAHAEILALRAAAEKLGSWRLTEATLFVTLEPCPMCAGACVAARVGRVVYAAADERFGAAYSRYNIVQDPRLNHACQLATGVLAEESAELLAEFFRAKRRPIEPL